MTDFIRLFLSRIIGGLVATFAAWLSTKWGIVIDADTQAQLITAIQVQFFVVFSIFYPIIHKWISSKINPGDAASGRRAAKEKAEVEVIRHG
jgi:hypothetical protein